MLFMAHQASESDHYQISCWLLLVNSTYIQYIVQQNYQMWKTPQKSPAVTTATSAGLQSARSEDQLAQQLMLFPQLITDNPQYTKLYQKIYKSQEKAYVSISEEEQKQTINNIKQTISRKLNSEEKESSFCNKFGRGVSYSARKVIKNDFRNLLGLTKLEQDDEKLNNFLINHKNAVELQQQARLAEYHLRDQQKTRSKIDYLNRIEQTSKHRRVVPHFKQRSEKLFKVDNQLSYHLVRKTMYIRNDKFMSKAITNAQNNPTYRRIKNFSQIQYILKQDSQNLMITHEIAKDQHKEKLYNLLRRIFISMALTSDSLRTYYDYIKQKQFANIVELVLPDSESAKAQKKLSEQYVMSVIHKIIKYKQSKVIHFEDYREVLKTVKDQKDYDVISHITQDYNQNGHKSKYKQFFVSITQQQIQQHKSSVKELLRKHKIEVLAKKIYEINRHKIISREYLPLRDILEFMKSINFVPKVITMSKFMHTCYWHQRRREGFTIQEFISIQVMLGFQMQGCLEGVDNYFKMFEIKDILMG